MNSLVFWCEFIDAVGFFGSCLCDPCHSPRVIVNRLISLNCGKYTVTKITKPERFRPFRFVRFSFSRSSLSEPFLSSGFLVLPGTYLMYDPIGKWRHTWQGKLFTFMAHFAYFCLPKRATNAKVSIYTFCVDLRQNYE